MRYKISQWIHNEFLWGRPPHLFWREISKEFLLLSPYFFFSRFQKPAVRAPLLFQWPSWQLSGPLTPVEFCSVFSSSSSQFASEKIGKAMSVLCFCSLGKIFWFFVIQEFLKRRILFLFTAVLYILDFQGLHGCGFLIVTREGEVKPPKHGEGNKWALIRLWKF